MILKQVPEDFVVIERPLFDELKISGAFCICLLSKRNFNTEDAVFEIARALKIPRKIIGYAGAKDRVAVTSQFVSIRASRKLVESFSHVSLSLEFRGFSDEPISLGRLAGNDFVVVVRGLSGAEKVSAKKIVNYFDSQRFSSRNVEVGKFLLKKDYKSAVDILREDSSFGSGIVSHLEKSLNDYVGALKTVPKKILTLYLHSYQSLLWNRAVDLLLEKKVFVDEVPIPGFGDFVADEVVRSVVLSIMADEGVSFSDFLSRDIPYLSVEGTSRKVFIEPHNLVIGSFLVDELNAGKKKISISFSLGKGEYATNVISQLFD